MFGKTKPAYWIRKTHLLRADEYICSACGRSFRRPTPVCPSCGRPMGGSKTDASWVDEAEFLDITDD